MVTYQAGNGDLLGAGEREDVHDEGSFQGGEDLVAGAIHRGILFPPPVLLSRSGEDPLVPPPVEVLPGHFAENSPAPCGVEARQDDPDVLLDQLIQGLRQVVDESLGLAHFNLGSVH